jgi:biotin operon repressor
VLILKPQDVLVLLKLAVREDSGRPSYLDLARSLGMSVSSVHAAMQRTKRLGLLINHQPNRRALLEFLVHGIRYVFGVERGELTRGMPTAYAAPPLSTEIASGNEPPPVWPDSEGTVRGETFSPLYKSVTTAARNDPQLYQVLALVDALRAGRARERNLAEQHLQKLIGR